MPAALIGMRAHWHDEIVTEVIEIPTIDVNDKDALFYSKMDYHQFQLAEQRRYDKLMMKEIKRMVYEKIGLGLQEAMDRGATSEELETMMPQTTEEIFKLIGGIPEPKMSSSIVAKDVIPQKVTPDEATIQSDDNKESQKSDIPSNIVKSESSETFEKKLVASEPTERTEMKAPEQSPQAEAEGTSDEDIYSIFGLGETEEEKDTDQSEAVRQSLDDDPPIEASLEGQSATSSEQIVSDLSAPPSQNTKEVLPQRLQDQSGTQESSENNDSSEVSMDFENDILPNQIVSQQQASFNEGYKVDLEGSSRRLKILQEKLMKLTQDDDADNSDDSLLVGSMNDSNQSYEIGNEAKTTAEDSYDQAVDLDASANRLKLLKEKLQKMTEPLSDEDIEKKSSEERDANCDENPDEYVENLSSGYSKYEKVEANEKSLSVDESIQCLQKLQSEVNDAFGASLSSLGQFDEFELPPLPKRASKKKIGNYFISDFSSDEEDEDSSETNVQVRAPRKVRDSITLAQEKTSQGFKPALLSTEFLSEVVSSDSSSSSEEESLMSLSSHTAKSEERGESALDSLAEMNQKNLKAKNNFKSANLDILPIPNESTNVSFGTVEEKKKVKKKRSKSVDKSATAQSNALNCYESPFDLPGVVSEKKNRTKLNRSKSFDLRGLATTDNDSATGDRGRLTRQKPKGNSKHKRSKSVDLAAASNVCLDANVSNRGREGLAGRLPKDGKKQKRSKSVDLSATSTASNTDSSMVRGRLMGRKPKQGKKQKRSKSVDLSASANSGMHDNSSGRGRLAGRKPKSSANRKRSKSVDLTDPSVNSNDNSTRLRLAGRKPKASVLEEPQKPKSTKFSSTRKISTKKSTSKRTNYDVGGSWSKPLSYNF